MLKGVDIVGILQNEKIKAKAITLQAPVIQIINTGAEKLYCLTLMVPNEGFAELVRSGFRVPLTAADMAVIAGAQTARKG